MVWRVLYTIDYQLLCNIDILILIDLWKGRTSEVDCWWSIIDGNIVDSVIYVEMLILSVVHIIEGVTVLQIL